MIRNARFIDVVGGTKDKEVKIMKNNVFRNIIIIASFIILTCFVLYQKSIHFSTKDEAIQHYLDSITLTAKPIYLVQIVETNIPHVYFLLSKSNGSSTINTVSNVTIKKDIFGWIITDGDADAVADLSKYLINN